MSFGCERFVNICRVRVFASSGSMADTDAAAAMLKLISPNTSFGDIIMFDHLHRLERYAD